MEELQGKRILVTGGSRGIGAAIVRQLAAAGATVGLHFGKSRQEAEAIQAAYPENIHLLPADLNDPKAISRLWQQSLERLGGIDLLVNNAGIAISSDLESESWLADWNKTLQVNLAAAAQLSQQAILHFETQQAGRIIFIGSRAASRGDTPDYLAYAASKAGLTALGKSIARGYGKAGIKAFVLAPGFTETDMAQDFIEQYGRNFVLDDLALSQLTQPDDIANWVTFLASGKGDHATGCTIDINAGSYVR